MKVFACVVSIFFCDIHFSVFWNSNFQRSFLSSGYNICNMLIYVWKKPQLKDEAIKTTSIAWNWNLLLFFFFKSSICENLQLSKYVAFMYELFKLFNSWTICRNQWIFRYLFFFFIFGNASLVLHRHLFAFFHFVWLATIFSSIYYELHEHFKWFLDYIFMQMILP